MEDCLRIIEQGRFSFIKANMFILHYYSLLFAFIDLILIISIVACGNGSNDDFSLNSPAIEIVLNNLMLWKNYPGLSSTSIISYLTSKGLKRETERESSFME